MKRKTEAEAVIGAKWADLAPLLDECSRRRWAATEARAVGYGGVVAVARATGLSRTTVFKGLAELGAEGGAETPARVRREGGGRMRLIARDPGLDTALDHLIDPIVRGDPESPLRWTTKSTEKLAAALRELGHKVSSSTVWRMLRAKGYRLQSTKKTLERRHHDDRDAQFIYIAGAVKDFHAAGDPAISVDTKKKELIGEFANGGREWHPSGAPVEVLGHDFPNEAIGKAIPYGVYDIGLNEALVNVGVNCDTSAFAVESIRRWWDLIGSKRYPTASGSSSRPTRAAATDTVGGHGKKPSRSWRRRRDCPSMSFTSRQGPASGTKSSIGSSATSRRTGAGDPCTTTPPSLNSSAPPQPRPD
jgi:transposase